MTTKYNMQVFVHGCCSENFYCKALWGINCSIILGIRPIIIIIVLSQFSEHIDLCLSPTVTVPSALFHVFTGTLRVYS